MEMRPLGNSGIRVAPLAFGGNVFGWTADEAASFRLLDRFVDAGFNLVDTANTYSVWVPGHKGGESESIIGKWLERSGKRDRIVLATKVGMELAGEKGLRASYIERCAEDSLRRLRTDTIDLYQSHADDPATPVGETLEAYARLVKAGKVRTIGASNFKPARLRESLAASERLGLPRYEVLQPHYNLYDRAEFEAELLPVAREHGLAVIPYFALARGFLTGKYRSLADTVGRPREASLRKFFDGDRGPRVLAALDQVAASRSASPARVAIAWLMARPGITAPIASATTLAQLDELIEATRLTLSSAEIAVLDAA